MPRKKLDFDYDIDCYWFKRWSRNKISVRTANTVCRAMMKNELFMTDIVNLEQPRREVLMWSGMGPKALDEFMGVYEQLKRDWHSYCEEVYS